jgi:hypothetical protein
MTPGPRYKRVRGGSVPARQPPESGLRPISPMKVNVMILKTKREKTFLYKAHSIICVA